MERVVDFGAVNFYNSLDTSSCVRFVSKALIQHYKNSNKIISKMVQQNQITSNTVKLSSL